MRAKPYRGDLTAEQAATAMQAARLNSLDLLDTAEILYGLRRFAHSVAHSILSIEEANKPLQIMGIFLGFGEKKKIWADYVNHQAKTKHLNAAIFARTQAVFRDLPLEDAAKIAARGPTPSELETQKQRSLYSDCVDEDGRLRVHLPRNAEWRQVAWERLCEARALALSLRDYPPDELRIWLAHAQEALRKGESLESILKPLHEELSQKGFVQEGSWDAILVQRHQKPR